MTTTIRVGGVPEHFNLPWRIAISDKAFESTGLNIEFVEFPGGTGAMAEALGHREIHLALMLTEGAVLDILQGSGNRLVKVFVESPLTWGIHVAAAGDIESIAGIEGRPIAISRYGSGSHLIAIVDAMERGFDLDALRFVVVDNLEGARKALATAEAEVFLWEKHMTQPLVDSGEFRRVGERVVPWPAFVVSAQPDFLSAHRDKLKPLLDIVMDYADRLQRDPAAAGKIADTYGISEHGAAAWLETVRWGHDYSMPAAAFEHVVAALAAQGAIESPPGSIADLWVAL